MFVNSAANFADDNALSSFTKKNNPASIMGPESETGINWLIDDYMILNPGIFWAVIFDEQKGNTKEILTNLQTLIIKKSKWYQKLNFLEYKFNLKSQ